METARSKSKKQQVMATKKKTKTGREANKETKNSVFCLQDGCPEWMWQDFSGLIFSEVTFVRRAEYQILMQRSSPWLNLLAFA